MQYRKLTYQQTVGGLTKPIVGASVALYVQGTNYATLADGVVNSGGAPTNPAFTDANGQVTIGAPNGSYDVSVVPSGGVELRYANESWVDVTQQVQEVADDAAYVAAQMPAIQSAAGSASVATAAAAAALVSGAIYASTADALSMGVQSITLVSGGSGSSVNGVLPATIANGTGSGAAYNATLSGGSVVALTRVSRGKGYTGSTTVTVPGATGLTGLNAVAVLAVNAPDGSYFWTVSTDGSNSALLWKNVGGVGTQQLDVNSKQISLATAGFAASVGPLLAALVAGTARSSALVPLAVDDAGNVPVWLEAGKLSAFGLADSLLAVISAAIGITILANRSSSLIALAYDDAGNVPLWLDNGLLGAAGVTPALMAAIQSSLSLANYATLNSVPAYNKPLIATDGRSLYRYRGKQAALKQTATTKVRIGVSGDSWADQPRIPQSLATLLYAAYGKTADGFISVSAGLDANVRPINAVTTAAANWTAYDITVNNALPLYKCGPDGYSISTTGATATFAIGALFAETLRIYYYDGTGSFRYRANGGSYTTVTGTGSGNIASVLISGLNGAAANTIDIDTTVNTGSAVVALHGFLADRTAGGITVHKLGNGSAMGSHFQWSAPSIPSYVSDLALDVLAIFLGTNDQRNSAGTAQYIAGITTLVNAFLATNPSMGVVLIVPAQNSTTALPPMGDYRTALLAFAQANGYEFYNMLDDWGTYAVENAAGQWFDSLHVSDGGSWRPGRALIQNFLGV